MLDHFYIATVYSALIVMFLSSATLFICRKRGDRSRLILSGIIFISVFNYFPKLLTIINGSTDIQVMSVPMLALAIFMIISYMTYPIEVISPGWITFKRMLKLYSPVAFIFILYGISNAFGVKYIEYNNLTQMLPHAGEFNVLFRLALCAVMFLPIFIIFFVPYTRIYSNTDKTWVRVYAILYVIDILSYIAVLTFHGLIVAIIYFHISMIITLIRVYMELVYRIVDKKVSKQMILAVEKNEEQKINEEIAENESKSEHHNNTNSNLYFRLQKHMASNQAWRDPNISLSMLTEKLGTNRTTLSKAIHDNGVESFSAFINNMRISDFISIVNNRKDISIKEAFFICGYRSRTTAIRNFKLFIGTTPSEYFGRNSDEEEW